jgi:hypothetical protein
MSAPNKTLPGARLKRSIELIDQSLHHRLQQFACGLENQLPEGAFEGQEVLLGGRLI